MPIVGKIQHPDHERKRRGPLHSLAMLPAIMSMGNLLCGFTAIFFAMRAVVVAWEQSHVEYELPGTLLELMLPSFLSLGAGLVMLAIVFDGLDLLLTRVTRPATDFAGQLDSLADVVSFGIAPATLMIAFMTLQLQEIEILPSPVSAHVLGRFAWISTAVYVVATAIRLAKHHAEYAPSVKGKREFRGLPTSAAAAFLASLLIFQDQGTGLAFRPYLVYIMPGLAIVTGFLMISRVPYVRFHRTYLLGHQPFRQFIIVMAILAVFWLYKAPTLVLLVFWYLASGPVAWMVRRIQGHDRDDEGIFTLPFDQSRASG